MIRGRVDYELVEHTADTGIVVRAPDLKTLFEAASSAMFDLMVDVDAVEPAGEALEIVSSGRDLETLLVAWLGELLSRAMTAGEVYGAFDVDRVEELPSGSWRAKGRVRGEPLDLDRHCFRTELKAVTYHGLKVERDAGGHSARVIFDQ